MTVFIGEESMIHSGHIAAKLQLDNIEEWTRVDLLFQRLKKASKRLQVQPIFSPSSAHLQPQYHTEIQKETSTI